MEHLSFLLPKFTSAISVFNFALGVIFFLSFFYQAVYLVASLVRGPLPAPAATKQHCFAVLICAHNEAVVIQELISSFKQQTYPSHLINIFVVADKCTDNTAALAAEAGAKVYEYQDTSHRGKSWAMDYGFQQIDKDFPGKFDGVFVFDADNVVAHDYVERMNDMFDQGFEVVTSYRNSKNFGDSWVSSAYALWFIREARFLNSARMLFSTSCHISGTGYLLSTQLLRRLKHWSFNLLTEDIQFSAWAVSQGMRIGYAHQAVFYDEQPVSFAKSWTQRMRWTKGFYQVFYHYGLDLITSIFRHKKFAGFDILMLIAPAMVITILSLVVNSVILIACLVQPHLFSPDIMHETLRSVLNFVVGTYLTFFVLGLVTLIAERKSIMCASKLRLFTSLFTFPAFMLTYVPIAAIALVKRVEWVPTPHTRSVTLDQITAQGSSEH